MRDRDGGGGDMEDGGGVRRVDAGDGKDDGVGVFGGVA